MPASGIAIIALSIPTLEAITARSLSIVLGFIEIDLSISLEDMVLEVSESTNALQSNFLEIYYW